MKIKSSLLALVAISIAAGSSHAAIIFTQDFSANNTLATYINASSPNSGQFNAISTSGAQATVGVNAGVLTFTRGSGNATTFSRTTDFSPTPAAISYQFNLTISGNSAAQTTAAVFQVGSGYGTANSSESNANTYARFGINLSATTGQFSIRDVSNGSSSATFSGTQSVFWVLNNTGASINYTDPIAAASALANDRADLWLGTTKVLNGVAIETASQSMTDLKFAFDGGSGTIGIDNIVITAIPEPSTALLGAFGALALLRRRR
jgi:hypothetical protein